VILFAASVQATTVVTQKISGQPSKTILIVGDSLSMGYGITLKSLWVNILQKQLQLNKYPHRIVNSSIGGDTTLSGLNRLPKSLLRHKPELVILELGANDGLRGLSLIQTSKNLDKMIQIIQKHKIKILLIGMKLPPNYGPAYTEKFKQIYVNLAKKYKIQLLPFMLSGVAGIKNYTQADGMHPNEKAQPFVYKNIWAKLEPMLGLIRAKPARK